MGKGQNILWVLFGLCLTAVTCDDNMKVVYQWSQLEFDYDSNETRAQDIADGVFLPGAIAPIDVDAHYASNKVFVSIPRFEQGVPSTLNTVTNKTYNNNTVLKPYPDWSWNKNLSNCSDTRLVSVYRMAIDKCDRLWVLDTGKIGNVQVCPPQILAFNLSTDALIVRHDLHLDPLEVTSILVTPVVDARGTDCASTYVYMLDCHLYTIFVYDAQKNSSWQIQDKTMYPDPSQGSYNILGSQMEIMDGLLGGALSPLSSNETEDRILYYHAMSSHTENWVQTSVLQNETYFSDNPALSAPEYFHPFPQKRDNHVAPQAIDSTGVMYFGLLENVTIGCWNTKTEYGMDNIHVVASNQETLQFPSGVKIVKNQGEDELWVMASRFQKWATGTLTTDEVNFRILAAKTTDLLKGSKCRN